MTATPLASVGRTPAPSWAEEGRRWLAVGLAVLVLLVGVAVVASLFAPHPSDWPGTWTNYDSPWSWVFGLLGLVIGLWILFWMARIVFWGIAAGPSLAAYRYRRHRWAYLDPASDIARERYARGEISREQYDELRRDLDASRP